jgi:phage FluMu gp28-like protein
MCQCSKAAQLIPSADYDRLLCNYPVPDSLDNDRQYGPLFVGIDIGRTHDLTVIWVWEQGRDPSKDVPDWKRDVLRPVCVRAIFNEPFDEQEKQLLEICLKDGHERPEIQKIVPDQGGIGYNLTESLKSEVGNIVEPMTIGPSKKGPLVESLRALVQQKRCLLPDDPDVRSDILSMRRVAPKVQGGQIRYEGGTQKTHADYYIAAALGLYAATSFGGLTLTMARTFEDEDDWQGEWARQ